MKNVDEIRLDGVSSLEKLTLEYCNVSAANFSQLVTGAPLVEVELGNFGGDVAAALQDLGKIASLRKLTLYSRKLTDGDIRRMGSFKRLQELDLSYNDELNDRSLRQLEGLRNLRSLGVWNTHVTAAAQSKPNLCNPRPALVILGKPKSRGLFRSGPDGGPSPSSEVTAMKHRSMTLARSTIQQEAIST